MVEQRLNLFMQFNEKNNTGQARDIEKVKQLQQSMRKLQLKKLGFDIEDGWTVIVKELKNSTSIKKIANFVAWPVREILIDDGTTEVKRTFDIKGVLVGGRELPEIRLSHIEFIGDLRKCLSQHWGLDVIVKNSNFLREAIQAVGVTRKKESVYTYTGWRKINDHWVFLHAGGAVGAENVRVDISEGGEALSRYALPSCCQDTGLAASVTFSIFDIASPQVMYPLFAVTFLAPLCEVLCPFSLDPDFMLFLIGRTQSGKSSLAALLLSSFGDFDKNHFPANYRQTASSLERTGFILKDVLMVVDDFYPGQSHKEREALKEMAQKLARTYGDGAVRNRIGPNGKLKQSYPPRGVAISTGEERPEIGESGQARFVFIDVSRDDMNYDELMKIQKQKRYLSEFMTMYLGWIAANWERIPTIFQETYELAKEQFFDEAYSGRINESIAKLCGGLEVVLTFAKEQGFINEEEYDRHGELAANAFQYVLKQNVFSLCAEKPTQKFLTALSEIISTGQGNVSPINAEALPVTNLGYYDEDYAYLLPTQCYKAVQAYYNNQGQLFPVGDKTLWRQLKNDGIIECSENRNRNTIQKRLPCLGNNNSVDVLKMHKYRIGL